METKNLLATKKHALLFGTYQVLKLAHMQRNIARLIATQEKPKEFTLLAYQVEKETLTKAKNGTLSKTWFIQSWKLQNVAKPKTL